MNSRKTERGAKLFLTCSEVRAALCAYNEPRKTERDAKLFSTCCEVRAAPFALIMKHSVMVVS
jgi:hypothetical protein